MNKSNKAADSGGLIIESDLKDQLEEFLKLSAILEPILFNNLSLFLVERINGAQTLLDMLIFYRKKIEEPQILR